MRLPGEKEETSTDLLNVCHNYIVIDLVETYVSVVARVQSTLFLLLLASALLLNFLMALSFAD